VLTRTREQGSSDRQMPDTRPVAGVVAVQGSTGPTLVAFRLQEDRSLELGRSLLDENGIDDDCMSRRHVRIALVSSPQMRGEGAPPSLVWQVEDLGSRNGTQVDGVRVQTERTGALRVVRAGNTLLVPVDDVRIYENARVQVDNDVIMGPLLGRALSSLERAARAGDVVHISGESGSGKELAARRFHRAGPNRQGPFVAVNCATIPEGLAERVLFGARKGAYSGATSDSEGFLQSADGGTLFLDEIGELEPSVQAKLLRAIEAREVVPLGATRGRPINLRLCSATHRDLRADVQAGRFREDLYFRVARPLVSLPPLRARPEEIPWLIAHELQRFDAQLVAEVALVEQCLLRPWPGNVRELRLEIRAAAGEAQGAGAPLVGVTHLSPSAGMGLQPTRAEAGAPAAEARRPRTLPSDDEVRQALEQEHGNVSAAARRLGVHRTQLRRWQARQQGVPEGGILDPESSAEPET
jgi:transcriptional regulator with PAS, ATPase and Fis domain